MRLYRSGLFAVALSGWVVVALELAHAPTASRTAATFLFAFFAPGLAVVLVLKSRDFLEQVVLSIALSLAIDVLVTESLALAHRFTGLLASLVLASLTSAISLVAALSHRQRAIP